MEDAYVLVNGKKYQRGYTTGACSAAAAKAAAQIAMTQQAVKTVAIDTPKGIRLVLKVHDIQVEKGSVRCAIQKDGGDDIDATHGMMIYAEVTLLSSTEIIIDGGKGIGRVTAKGLGLPIGSAAINKVPRQMIESEVRQVIGPCTGAKVVVFAPEGEAIARKTFNPRLGIVGGISIIGTTGIVEPMSDEGWKQSLALELEMKRAQGYDVVVFVGGNHGEKYAIEQLGCRGTYIVHTSNFVGHMLMAAQSLGYRKVLVVGHIGKLIKVAGGIFHTHSRVADARHDILIAHLALLGAPLSVLQDIAVCTTMEAAVQIVEETGYTKVYDVIAKACVERIGLYLKPTCEGDEVMDVEVIIFTLDGRKLGETVGAKTLLEVVR
ncbi:MAG: cobalt-precorrin-5B (C(1))-methyltransferase CbiD [Cellulosilyticaceae bacterium]